MVEDDASTRQRESDKHRISVSNVCILILECINDSVIKTDVNNQKLKYIVYQTGAC